MFKLAFSVAGKLCDAFPAIVLPALRKYRHISDAMQKLRINIGSAHIRPVFDFTLVRDHFLNLRRGVSVLVGVDE